MDIISQILSLPDLESAPPVLIDIGASGALHPKWKRIAKHSICVAFDADTREMNFVEKESKTFKKLIVFSRAVTDQPGNEIDFYLTKSPYCSSALEPDNEKLKVWAFDELFEVEKRIKLKAIQLSEALRQAKVATIDWFKADTQGTDLRLFRSLPEAIRNHIIVAEFEPGILDAYKGEDKLHEVVQYMGSLGFFLSSMDVKGTHRISRQILDTLGRAERKVVSMCHTKSPGWAELTYIKALRAGGRRSFLLAILFSLIERQFGFACELSDYAYTSTNDSIFLDLKKDSIRAMKQNNRQLPRTIVQKAGRKFLSYL